MSNAKAPATMHMARMAMNRQPEIRAWAEQWLKARERAKYSPAEGETDEAFEKHWRYSKPELMHEGALDAYEAYLAEVEGR